jgi:hypothetical protein
MFPEFLSGSYFGISCNFTIYDAADSRTLIRKCLTDLEKCTAAGDKLDRHSEKTVRSKSKTLCTQVGMFPDCSVIVP